MAIKFSQFNLRTDHTSGMYLVGYDGNQNIHITVDNLFDDFINGTENTIAMFGTGGTALADSILSQDAGATLLTVAGQLNVDAAATFDTSVTVTGDSTLNGNVTLGDASTDLITQTGTLYLNGPIKDTTDTLGAVDQILVSDAAGELTFQNLLDTHVGSSEVVRVPVKNAQGSPLAKGDPVYISGSVGASGRLEVQLADSSNSAKMPAVGLLFQNLVNNEEGYVVITGKLRNIINSPIDGVTPTEGDIVYVKPSGISGAALTTTKPVYGNFIQNVGKVGRVSTNSDGTFVVSSILRSNDIPNLTPGRLWVGSTGNTIESQTLFVDEANGRLGINETNPGYSLDVDGTLQTSGWAYFATSGPSSLAQVGGGSTTTSQFNIISTATGGSFIAATNTLTLKTNNVSAIKINNASAVQFNQYGGGVYTGTAAYNLSVDSSGNVIETAAVPANIVETITTTDGTYINLTPNSPTDGAVTVTADLSATGTADATKYLRGDNTWSPISGIYDWNISDGTNSETIVNGDTVTFSGDTYITTTYTAGNNTLSIDHDDTSRTDTTSTDNPGNSGTFQAVTSVSTNGTGHVTGIDVSTVTLPSAYSWAITADTGLTSTVINGNTVDIAGGTNINTEGKATDTVEINLDDSITLAGTLTVNGTGQSSFAGQVTIPQVPSANTDAASKHYVDQAVTGALSYQGGYNPSTNIPDLTSSPNSILKGWTYTVTADSTFFGEQVRVGDVLIAEIDNPTNLTDWTTVQNNIDLADLNTVGIGNVAAGTNIGVSYSNGTATISNGITNNNQLTNGAGYTSNTGTVTSVAAIQGSGISITGSPITTSGTLTISNTDRGSSQNIFKNFAVSGQSTVVADSNNDTLTLVAGSNISLTTSAANDSITINATDTNTNNYVSSISFNTTDGVLTLNRSGLSSLTVDLDGRYLTGNQTITLSGDVTGSGTTSISTNISSNVVGANELNVSGNGTSGQVLTSDGDGTFSWSTPTTGDITAVTAGNGLTGGGTAGAVTLTVGQGTGIQVNATNVALATAGPGAGTYGSTSNSTKIDTITLDAYGRVISVANGATGSGNVTGSGTANYISKWSTSTGLTNSIIYDNGTNVGIGTTNPLEKLQVNGNIRLDSGVANQIGIISYGVNGKIGATTSWTPDTGSQPGLWVEGSNDGESGGIFMNGNTCALWSPGDQGILKIYDEDNFGQGPVYQITGAGNSEGNRFYSIFDTAYYLDPDGDSQLNTLDIDDYVRHRGDTNTYIGFPANDTFIVTTANSERVRVTSSGNVGIGTGANVDERLHVEGSVNNDDVAIKIENTFDDNNPSSAPTAALVFAAASTNGYIRVHGAPADTAAKHQIDIGSTASSSYLTFSPSTTEKMRITSGGNVGIGTSSPGYKLDVNGQGNFSDYLNVGASTGIKSTGWVHLHRYGSSTNVAVGNNGTNVNLYVPNGNVGIGTTSPASKLDVNGGIRMADDSSTASASNVGTLRYRTSGNNSYVDMCMQTGTSTYAWVNIVQNSW